MKAITNTTASSLEWREPTALEPRFELHSGDEVLATMALEPLCRTLATAETAEGTWTFRQTGILSTTVHVREVGSDQDLAVFHPGFPGRGTLRFASGMSFRWRRDHPGGSWSFRGEDGKPLLTLRLEKEPPGVPWPHRTQAEVEISPAGRSNPRIPLLTALGWYLILLHQ